MKLGPILAPTLVPSNPLKPLTVKTAHTPHTVLFGGSVPAAMQSDVIEYTLDLPLLGSTAAKSRAILAQVLELAQNAEWQRAGVYMQLREDISDAQDGWYGISSVEIPEEEPNQAGWATAAIDILLRDRRNPNIGVYVDAKAMPNDANLAGLTLAALPQGITAPYPVGTWAFPLGDGSAANCTVAETPPTVMQAAFSNPANMMSQGRCGTFDSSTVGGSDTEIFHPDHRMMNRYLTITNGLVRYTIDLTTAGSPTVEGYTGAGPAWNTHGNFQLQSYSGAAYTVLPVQTANLLVVSPEEIIWQELRYDVASVGLVRVICRLRRGSRLVECQIVAASGQGLIGPQSVGLVSVPAGVTGLSATPDGTAIVGTGSTTLVPGFCFLNAATSVPSFSSTTLYSGFQVAAGTVGRIALLVGNPNDNMWTAMAATTTPSAPVVTSTANLLTVNQASLETGTTGWTAATNCTIAQTAAQAFDGTKSLQVTASSAATMAASTPTGTSGTPVLPNVVYTAIAQLRTAVTARVCTLFIDWYTSGGVLISSAGSPTVNDTTSGWTQATVFTATSPANAAFATIRVQFASPANAEVHYIDGISLAAGNGLTWAAPPASPATIAYKMVAVNQYGTDSAQSTAAQITTGPSTLDATHYTTITFPALPSGAVAWKIIRTVASGTPSTVGIITPAQVTGASYNDTGKVATTYSAVGQEQSYANRWASYNRTRVKQRILVSV